MTTILDIQYACEAAYLPTRKDFRRWVTACLKRVARNPGADHEVSIRIVDRAEITALNRQYRHKNKPTNVLSFPAEFPAELAIPLLGDIIICAEVVADEAREQQKELTAHWAHMTIHGMLHLLGHDHIEDKEAAAMEALETMIMLDTGYPAPYIDQPGTNDAKQHSKPDTPTTP